MYQSHWGLYNYVLLSTRPCDHCCTLVLCGGALEDSPVPKAGGGASLGPGAVLKAGGGAWLGPGAAPGG